MREQATPVGSQSAGTAEDGHQLSHEIVHPGFDYVWWQTMMRGIFKSMCALLFIYFLLEIVTMHKYLKKISHFLCLGEIFLEREQNKTRRMQD